MKKPIFKSRKFRVALALTVALTCFISQLVPAFAVDELLGIPKTDEVKIETPVEGNAPVDGEVPPAGETPIAPPTEGTPIAPPEGGIVGEPTAPVAPPTGETPTNPGDVVIPPVEGPNGAETPTVPTPPDTTPVAPPTAGDGEFIGPVGPVGPVGPHTPGAGTRIGEKVIYVKEGLATGNADGTTADNAYKTLAAALTAEKADKAEIRILADMTGVTANISVNMTNAADTISIIGYSDDGTTKQARTITRDATLTGSSLLTVTKGVLTLENIVLNGNKINCSATAPLVTVAASQKLTLGNGAKVTNGTNSKNYEAGGIAVKGSGTLTMNTGSEISNNATTADSSNGFGGGVDLAASAVFTMNGGTITGNSAAANGSAISAESGSILNLNGGEITANTSTSTSAGNGIFPYGATINVSGAPKIYNNTNSNSTNTKANIYLPSNQKIVISSALSLGANICLSTPDPTSSTPVEIVASGAVADDAQYFHCDSVPTAITRLKGAALEFAVIDAAYVSSSGNDSNNGKTVSTPVKTLTKAFEKVATGGEIRLLSDIEVTDTVAYNASKTITIKSDAGQYTIKNAMPNGTTKFLMDISAGIVNLENVIVDGGAKWGGTADTTLNRGTTNNGKFSGSQMINITGGAFNLNANAVLQNHDNKSTRGAQYDDYGGAVRLVGGKMSMTDATSKILNNSVTGGVADGGAVAIWGGVFTMTAGEMKGNFASRFGGAVRVDANDGFVMNGGSITNNKSKNGGGICPTNGADFKMQGTPVVTLNTDMKNAPNNVYLENKSNSSIINVTGALTSGANIGIKTETAPTTSNKIDILTGADLDKADESYIKSDITAAIPRFVSGSPNKIQLIAPLLKVYVANSNVGEGCITAGDDATGDGTIAKPYLTIAKAYSEVEDNGTINVMDDVEFTSTAFEANKKVTITSCKANGDDWATGSTINKLLRNGAKISLSVNAGELTFKNVDIKDKAEGYENSPICISDNAKVIMDTGAKITDTDSKFSAVYIFAGTLEMKTGSSIKGHKNIATKGTPSGDTPTEGVGGGVTLGTSVAGKVGHLIMSGGEISGNVSTHAGTTSGFGGGVYVIQGDITISGNAKIYDNKDVDNKQANVYLRNGQTIKLNGLTTGAKIGVSTQNAPSNARDIRIATGAKNGENKYFVTDNELQGGIKQTDSDVYLSYANRAVAKIGATMYQTFDDAMRAVKANETITLLADCTTGGAWNADRDYIIDGSANKYTLSMKGRFASQNAASIITVKNIVLKGAANLSEIFHIYGTMKFDNCELPSFCVVKAVELKNSTINGNLRIDGRATNISLNSSNVKCTGQIQIGAKGQKVTLLAGSDATNSYNVTYAKNITLTDGKVVFDGTASHATADMAKKVTIGNGTQWAAAVDSNNIVLKTPKAYYVKNTGNDTSGAGSSTSPYKTIAKAYAVAAVASPSVSNISINLLSDLPSNDTTTIDFNSANIDRVIIQSATGGTGPNDQPTIATTAWKATRPSTTPSFVTITNDTVVLGNVTLDGAKGTIDSTTSLVTVATDGNLIMSNDATLQNNSSSAAGGAISIAGSGTVTMNEGSKICGNSTTAFGGGIQMSSASTFTMNGGEISDNHADSDGQSGGAISMYNSGDSGSITSSVTINGGKITNNTAKCNGSAIHGAIDVNTTGSTITIANATITGNKCDPAGANPGSAIFLYGSELTVAGSTTITGNYKGMNSKNIYLPDGKYFTVDGELTGKIGVTTRVAPTSEAEVRFANNTIAQNKDHFIYDLSGAYFARPEKENDELSDSLYFDFTPPAPNLPPITGGGGNGNGGGGNGGTNVKEVTVEIPEGGDKNNWPDGNSPKLEVSDEDYSSSLRLIVSPLKATTKQGKNFAKISCYRFLGMHSVDLLDGTQKIYKTNGKAKVFLPFKGKDDVSYTVFRQNENGTITMIGATYKDGYLSFETDEFCNTYAISTFDEKAIVIDKPNKPTTNPATGVALLGKLF